MREGVGDVNPTPALGAHLRIGATVPEGEPAGTAEERGW